MAKKKILERDIESYLRDQVRSVGGEAYKFTSPNRRSVPDRVCVFPQYDCEHAIVVYVECKAPGKTWTPLQARERDRLLRMYCDVWLCASYEDADTIVETFRGDL